MARANPEAICRPCAAHAPGRLRRFLLDLSLDIAGATDGDVRVVGAARDLVDARYQRLHRKAVRMAERRFVAALLAALTRSDMSDHLSGVP